MELKPCKCGNTKLWRSETHRFFPSMVFPLFAVECCKCGHSSKLCWTRRGADRDWNRRVKEDNDET